jgi:hypothetical protein
MPANIGYVDPGVASAIDHFAKRAKPAHTMDEMVAEIAKSLSDSLARSGEAKAPGSDPVARAEEEMPESAPPVEPEPVPPPPQDESEPVPPIKPEPVPPHPQGEPEPPPRTWQPEDVKEWFKWVKEIDPQKSGENNSAYARRLHARMEKDFENPPWIVEAIRRRLNDPDYD